MEYWVLCYVSLMIMLIYLTLGITVFARFRKILDPFMKSNIIIYLIAFCAKPVFWYFCYKLEVYNLSIENIATIPLVPIRSTIGSVISAMCFMILQIIIIRIILAYYHLKAVSEDEQVRWSKIITKALTIHLVSYVVLVSL